jgi:hypothetical protein
MPDSVIWHMHRIPTSVASARFSALLLLASANAIAQANDEMRSVFDGIEPIVHVRTYFWDSQNTSGDRSEAWALGGWAGAKTRWYGDVLQLGVLGYTSQKLYGPADKGGSQLLAPGQDPINVLGQAYGSLRYAGQTFTGYRQTIEQPWVNPYDTRMIPNLFEGYLLSGKIADLEYIGGYVTKFKARDSNAFEWMSSGAGSTGSQQGMVLAGARLPLAVDGYFRIAEQYLIDTYNTAYVDGAYPLTIGADSKLQLRGQYGNQQSVGSAGLGAFNTWMFGVGSVYERGPVSIQAAWTQTSRNRQTLAPFGVNPSFLHMMQVDFNDADEKAWLIGGALDFTTIGAPGLKGAVIYGNGHGAIDSSTGASLGSRNETDIKLSYVFDKSSKLQGLSLGIEGSWLNQAGAVAQGRQLRVYANYDIPFNLHY